MAQVPVSLNWCVKGGGKVDHMGGSIVGLRLSTFRGNVRLSVQQKCHRSNPGSHQMSTAPVVRFAAAVYSDPENGPESAPLCPLWPICASPWTVCLSLLVGGGKVGHVGSLMVGLRLQVRPVAVLEQQDPSRTDSV